MEFEQLIKDRFSCRDFSNKKIDKNLLEKILKAGQIAPTARNLQPFTIYVLEHSTSLKKIDSITHCRYNAPIVLIFTYKKDEEWTNSQEPNIRSGVEDVSIVATHVMLEAKNLGIDSCWCNHYPNSKLELLFDIPKNEKSVLIMPIGYASSSAVVSPMHTSKKDLEKIVNYL